MTNAEPILSVHKTRFMARKRERAVQARLNGYDSHNGEQLPVDVDKIIREYRTYRGVRVEKAGRFQFVVRLTKLKGH